MIGDEGVPNGGNVGAVCPISLVSPNEVSRVLKQTCAICSILP